MFLPSKFLSLRRKSDHWHGAVEVDSPLLWLEHPLANVAWQSPKDEECLLHRLQPDAGLGLGVGVKTIF